MSARPLDRRRFLRTTAAGAAVVTAGGLATGTPAQAAPTAATGRTRQGAVSFR